MRRSVRAIRFAGLSLIGGAVVTTLIAEGIGYSGAAHYDIEAPQRFVAAGSMCIRAYDVRGRGWRFLDWDTLDRGGAVIYQYMYDKKGGVPEDQLDLSYLHCDAPESLPPWARRWHAKDLSDIYHESGEELGVGWPLLAFSMDWSPLHTDENHGGIMLSSPPSGIMRVLVWRPIATGFAADTLIWSAALAGLSWGTAGLRRTLRHRRGACGGCGYDLCGLPRGGACPECGSQSEIAHGK